MKKFIAIALLTLSCTPANSPTKSLVDCYAQALKPVPGELFDEVELAVQIANGKATLDEALSNLERAPTEVKAVEISLKACKQAATPDAGVN